MGMKFKKGNNKAARKTGIEERERGAKRAPAEERWRGARSARSDDGAERGATMARSAERRWRGARSARSDGAERGAHGARSAERAPVEERSDENIFINLKLQPTVTTSVTVTTPTHSPYLGPVQSTPYKSLCLCLCVIF